MISVSLMGGLGNQMFQIASTWAHAKRHGFDCGFDLSYTDLPLQGYPAKVYTNSIYRNLPKIRHSDYKFEAYKEPRWEYSPIPPKDNILLRGYFQSPRHFDEYRHEIIDLFVGGVYAVNKYADYHNHSVSVHVRKGDYEKFPNIHPVLDATYYYKALSDLDTEEDVEIDNILVFSDDIAWAKALLRDPRIRFIEGKSDYESLLMMSFCDHNIIANSSFSWWGAYLNRNSDKIVYAPKIWNGKGCNHTWDDIYLKEMRLC